MRVCDICRKTLGRDDDWWSINSYCNEPHQGGEYYELCPEHKNQIIGYIKLKIQEEVTK